MKLHAASTLLLSIAVLFLCFLAADSVLAPRSIQAESVHSSNYYVEPGTTTLREPDGTRQVEGKVVIDLRNGNVWGFPTQASLPYPVDVTKATPAVSHPIYLGKYDFAVMEQAMKDR